MQTDLHSPDPFAQFGTELRQRFWPPPPPTPPSTVAATTPSSPSPDDFDSLAVRLFRLQFEHVPPYRALCLARGISPASIRCWNEIPALPVTAFKEYAVTSLGLNQRPTVFHSSGTTQLRPSRHFHDRSSLELYETSAWHSFRQSLLPDLDPRLSPLPSTLPRALLFLTPPPAQAPHSSLVHMFGTVAAACPGLRAQFAGQAHPDGRWQIDAPALLAFLHQVESTQEPVCLGGTAFGFVHLLDAMENHRVQFNLARGSRLLETGGYKGRSRSLAKAELHHLLSAHLGLPPSMIVSEYGMSELSSQAYDRVAHPDTAPPSTEPPAFRFPGWARAVVVSPETGHEVTVGERGLLRLYDLANVRSVLALQTEDLARREPDGFTLLGRATMVEPRGCSLAMA